jgi:hypothetical protein
LIRDDTLIQKAYFVPRGLWGRMYWFLMKPFHTLIFGAMGQAILRKAKGALESRRADRSGGGRKRPARRIPVHWEGQFARKFALCLDHSKGMNSN